MFIKRSIIGRFEPLIGDSNSRSSLIDDLNRSQTLTSSSPYGSTHQFQSNGQNHIFLVPTKTKASQNQGFTSSTSKDSSSDKSSLASFIHEDKENKEPNKPSLTPGHEQQTHDNPFPLNKAQQNHQQGWRYQSIEVKKPWSLFQDLTLEDPQIDKWDLKFTEYDMDEDKENIPSPNEEHFTSESDEEDIFEETQDESNARTFIGSIPQLYSIQEVEELSESRFCSRTMIKADEFKTTIPTPQQRF